MTERVLVRVFVAVALGLALLAFVVAPIPESAKGDPTLPAPALEQVVLYKLEVALLVFYGGLLLVTPAFAGLSRGRLPTEISVRGAKFAAEAEESADRNEADIRRIEGAISSLSEALATANAEIEQLKTTHNRG